MNDIFTPNRFYLSIRRLFVEKGIKMFGCILIILLILTLLLNMNFELSFYIQARIMFLVMALMFGPILYMSIVANEFNNNSKGISYLLMPNSRFEKWLLNLLSIGLFYIVFGGLFRLIDLWMVGRFSDNLALPNGTLEVMAFNSDVFIISALVGSAISLGILLGSHYFKKNSLILSLMIMFVVIIAAFFLDYFFANLIFEGNVLFGDSIPFGSVFIIDPSTAAGQYELAFDILPVDSIALIFIPIIAVLSFTYFVRIKEKQL